MTYDVNRNGFDIFVFDSIVGQSAELLCFCFMRTVPDVSHLWKYVRQIARVFCSRSFCHYVQHAITNDFVISLWWNPCHTWQFLEWQYHETRCTTLFVNFVYYRCFVVMHVKFSYKLITLCMCSKCVFLCICVWIYSTFYIHFEFITNN